MKKIIVPVDFSEFSENAGVAAIAIAKTFNASVEFVHLTSVDEDWLDLMVVKKQQDNDVFKTDELIKYQESKLDEIKKALQEYVDGAKKQNVQAKYVLAYNQPPSEIAKVAKKLQAELIVMGTHGASGISSFLGSNAQKVVRLATCPVLTVKSNHSVFKFNKVVFASDFQFKNSLAALKSMEWLFEKLNSQVELVMVNTPNNFVEQREYEERMANFVSHFPNQNFKYSLYNQFSVDEGVINFAEDNKADLIFMATSGFTGFRGLLHESVCELVVNYAKIPVLSIKV